MKRYWYVTVALGVVLVLAAGSVWGQERVMIRTSKRMAHGNLEQLPDSEPRTNDAVFLDNGDKLSGRILRLDGEMLVVEAELVEGEVRVPFKNVKVALCRTPVEAEDYQRAARFVLGIENCFSGAFLMATMFDDTYALWFDETADRVFPGSQARARELRGVLNRLAGTGRITRVERGVDLDRFEFPRRGFAGDPQPIFVERAGRMLRGQ